MDKKEPTTPLAAMRALVKMDDLKINMLKQIEHVQELENAILFARMDELTSLFAVDIHSLNLISYEIKEAKQKLKEAWNKKGPFFTMEKKLEMFLELSKVGTIKDQYWNFRLKPDSRKIFKQLYLDVLSQFEAAEIDNSISTELNVSSKPSHKL